jgi:hypothetical protein
MPENIIDLPDGKKLVVFETNQHPDFSGTSINIQEVLQADIPTYQIVADNVSPALNKNILAIFNRLATKRIRIQEVIVYPKTLANHVITLQLGYINSVPTGGTDLTLVKHSADFPNNVAAPNDVVAQTGATATPISDIIFGGNTFSVNTAGTYIIFEKGKTNGSAIQLRPGGLDGLVLRQTAGTGTTGTITAHMVFTLD